MRTERLLLQLTLYYLAISALLFAADRLYPDVRAYLPIGGVETLLSQPPAGTIEAITIGAARVENLGESLTWLIAAIAGAILTALPVSWTYMAVRGGPDYDQSLAQTIVILPIVVTGIVVVVHNSLALAFALAGIAAAVQFRNALRRPGDAVFVLAAIGIGLAAGIGAVELAVVMSIAFNYCFLIMWINDYGARKGTQRFLRRSHERPRENATSGDEPAETAVNSPGSTAIDQDRPRHNLPET
jgi:hypothetical protein